MMTGNRTCKPFIMKRLIRITFTQRCIVFFILLIIALAGSLSTIELRAEEPRRAIVAMEMIMPESDIPAQYVTVYHHFKGWNNRPFALAMYH